MAEQNRYMQTMENSVADYMSVHEPYADQWELMRDFMSLLDLRLYYIYKYHCWVGPKNNLQNMMGLVISREEFEKNLSKAVEAVVGAELSGEEKDEIISIEDYFEIRLKATRKHRPELPAVSIIDKFGFDAFESNCLLLGFAVNIEKKYEKIFAYLQDDITKKLPTADTAIHLFARPGDTAADYYRYFVKDKALSKFFFEYLPTEPVYNQKLALRSGVLEYLVDGRIREDGEISSVYDGKTDLDNLETDFETAKRLASVIPPLRGIGKKETVVVFLTGANGSGRKFQIKHAIHQIHSRCLFINMEAILESGQDFEGSLINRICEAVLERAYLCFTSFETLLQEEADRERHAFVSVLNGCAEYLRGCVFAVSEKEWKETGLDGGFVKVDINFNRIAENDRLRLWQAYTAGFGVASDVNLGEIASKFRFTPGQIKNSVTQASGLCAVNGNLPIDTATLHQCCYSQVVMNLSSLATRVSPNYTFDDIILPGEQIDMLKEACNHVRFRHTVFHQWGYDKKISYGGGLSMLFSGPPGTGKTMAAQVVANYLHMEMYKVQLSQIVSKYIGETEKNLRQIFNEAKNASCILFFDETDALFGKRSEVKDSHDRHANIEVAYLLQQMEEYDGVVIMATNLLQNIDEAFMRRISFIISFPFPDAKTRLGLWKKMLETDIPVSDDVNLEYLSEQFKIAGGGIKNIVLNAAFLAASENAPLSMAHILKSTVGEQRKNKIIVVKEDLGEYADLVFH